MTAKHIVYGVIISALGMVVGEYLKREIFQNEA
jgi:hypothetical protein